MVLFISRRSGDFHQTLLKIGVVFLVDRVELFDIKLFEDIFDELLTSYNLFNVGVFGFCLVSILFAVGDAVSNIKKLFGYFSDCKTLALLDLPELHKRYF